MPPPPNRDVVDVPDQALPQRRIRSRRRKIADRLVFVVLPAVVVSTIVAALWSGLGSDGVPSDIREEARRNCSIPAAGGATPEEGTPAFDRCVSDWIAILWD